MFSSYRLVCAAQLKSRNTPLVRHDGGVHEWQALPKVRCNRGES